MSSQFAVFIEPSKAPYYERIVLVNGIILGHQYYSTYTRRKTMASRSMYKFKAPPAVHGPALDKIVKLSLNFTDFLIKRLRWRWAFVELLLGRQGGCRVYLIPWTYGQGRRAYMECELG